MARKITQIATAGLSDTDCALFALADDGTLWELDYRLDQNWRLVPPLPNQEDEVIF